MISGAGQPAGNGYGSPQWSDNVGRMHLFMQRHPGIVITVPAQNGTRDFIAREGEKEVGRDTSLGWLMDNLEKRFPAGED